VVKLKPFDVVLAVIDEVAWAEKDQLLGVFGHGELRRVRDRLWWQRETGQLMAIIKNLPDGEKVMEKWLAGLPAKKRLEGLSASEVLKALPAKELEVLEAQLAARRAVSKRRGASRRSH
jgi:hypothetical protein